MSMERNERSIVPDLSYLEKFLRNLVLDEKNELKNRFLHFGFKAEDNSGSKSKNCTLNCTLEELAALRFLKRNPKPTQEQVAKHLGRSERTIKSMTVRLFEWTVIDKLGVSRNCIKLKYHHKITLTGVSVIGSV